MPKKNAELNVKTEIGYDQIHLKNNAKIVTYDNNMSKLLATNVQDALDEINYHFLERVTVNLSTTTGALVSGSTITVTDTTDPSYSQSYTLLTGETSRLFVVIDGHNCTISVSPIATLITPAPVTFTAVAGNVRTVNMVYSDSMEIINVKVSTNTGASVVGTVITLTDNTVTSETETYTLGAGETSHQFIKVFGRNCILSVSDKIGFATPLPVSFTTVAGNIRNENMVYSDNIEIVTVNVSTSNAAPVDGTVITITDNTVTTDTQTYTLGVGESSRQFSVVGGHNCVASVSNKVGFSTPATVAFTSVSGGTRTIPMVYLHNIMTVNVNVSTSTGATVDGTIITITDNTVPSDTQSYTLVTGESTHQFAVIGGRNCTVSVSAKAGFYNPPTVTFLSVAGEVKNVDMKYIDNINYGYRITKSEPNPYDRVTYLSDCSSFIPSKMNYTTSTWEWGSWESFVSAYFRPCMLNYNGTVAYYLDPTDQTKKMDGTPSDISNMSFGGNAMVEVKKLYTYEYEDGTYSYHMISDKKLNANYVAYPFTNASGVEKDFAYFPMFEGSLDSSNRMRSIAGQTISVSKTGQQEIDYVNNNGSGYYTDYWSAHNFMAVMHTLLGKSTDSQTVFGQGNNSGLGSALQTGALKASGGFFGYSTTQSAVKTFWMENNWGNIYKRCMGVVTDGSSNLLVKMTAPYNPAGSGYTNLGATPANGYIKNITVSNNGYEPIDTTGSATTYFCDYFYKNPTCYGLVSGSWSDGSLCGCFFLYVYNAFSYSNTSFGCRPFFINP